MKKKFLVPLSVAMAALAQTSQAAITAAPPSTEPSDDLSATQAAVTLPQSATEGTVRYPIDGNLFEFVLRRSVSGDLMAYHSSQGLGRRQHLVMDRGDKA